MKLPLSLVLLWALLTLTFARTISLGQGSKNNSNAVAYTGKHDGTDAINFRLPSTGTVVADLPEDTDSDDDEYDDSNIPDMDARPFGNLAENPLWEECLCRGTMLTETMNSPVDTLLSQFKAEDYTVELFENWGWMFQPPTDDNHESDLEHTWGLTHALESMGLNGKTVRDGGRHIPVNLKHYNPRAIDDHGRQIYLADQTYTHNYPDGKEVKLPCTSSNNLITINPKEGVMTLLSNHGPAHYRPDSHPDGLPESQLPDLRRFSDIAFGLWKLTVEANNGDISNINYFAKSSVSNAQTLAVLARASEPFGEERPKERPGRSFFIGSEGYTAILGTPNGRGIGYFLAQHKKELGLKRVSSIKVFQCDEEENEICMMFYVHRVPPPPPEQSGA